VAHGPRSRLCNDPRSASTKIGYGRLRPGRMQLAHVTSDTHDAGAYIDGLRDEQVPHLLHMVDRQVPCTRGGIRIDIWNERPT
jgi:hypothetical protein